MISILGPTAVGKSRLAIEIAAEINGEIISADSMQVYRGMDIGTSKPSPEECRRIPHHLIDVRNPDEEWTVSDFVKQADQLVKEISEKGRVPIIVGGTGLYLWALFEGFSFPIAAADKELRQRLESEPLSDLYSRLSRVDPQAAEKIHFNDRKRIIRALEVYELSGNPISRLQKQKKTRRLFAGSKLIGLTLPRERIYERIEARIDEMLEKGLVQEVKDLLAKGYSKDLPSFQALGYKEVIEHLDGRWAQTKMVEELKKRTRNFARRQMTWFKRFNNIKWFEQPVDTRLILDYINKV